MFDGSSIAEEINGRTLEMTRRGDDSPRSSYRRDVLDPYRAPYN